MLGDPLPALVSLAFRRASQQASLRDFGPSALRPLLGEIDVMKRRQAKRNMFLNFDTSPRAVAGE
jgi:hypothetical protein